MEDIINVLKNEAQLLTNKIAKYQKVIESATQERERKDSVSTYTNLIRALQEVLSLIDKYDWKLKKWSSKYDTIFDFQHSMGLPRTVFKTTDDIRGVGKTSWLVNKANETGGYYVAKYNVECKYATDMGCKEAINGSREDWYVEIPKHKALFIDEDVFADEEELKKFEELNKEREYFIFYRVK